jgi:hypothetical protein
MYNQQTNNFPDSGAGGMSVVSAMVPFFYFPLSRLHNQPPVRFHFPPNTWRKQPRTGLRSVPGLPTTIHPGLSRGTNVQVASGCPSVDFHTLPR